MLFLDGVYVDDNTGLAARFRRVKAPTSAERTQLQQKQQQEAAFHSVLSFVAWRSKDYTQAAREYTYLVEKNPNEAVPNYRLGLSLLQKNSPDYLHGFWHVARAISFNVGRKDDV